VGIDEEKGREQLTLADGDTLDVALKEPIGEEGTQRARDGGRIFTEYNTSEERSEEPRRGVFFTLIRRKRPRPGRRRKEKNRSRTTARKNSLLGSFGPGLPMVWEEGGLLRPRSGRQKRKTCFCFVGYGEGGYPGKKTRWRKGGNHTTTFRPRKKEELT